jgi:tetratricopeptide (TPR) repeat protein
MDNGHTPHALAGRRPSRWAGFATLLVAAAAVASAWPARNGRFLAGDDHRLILDHYLVNHPSAAHAWELLTGVHGDLYQPLPMLSFQANYALAGPDPSGRFPVRTEGFHQTNLAIHALNSALAFLLASRLAGCSRVGLLAGLMFACHPFAVEAVAWINGRMILLASSFSLGLLLLATTRPAGSDRRWSLATVGLWAAALASKVIPTVPVAAAWCDLSAHGRLHRRRTTIHACLLGAGLAAAWASLGIAAGIVTEATLQEENLAGPAVRMPLALRYYVENYVWPLALAPWSPPPLAGTGIAAAPVLLGFMEALALLVVALAARRTSPASTLGLGLFALLLIPFLAAGESRRLLAADRYMYLPIFGLHLAAATAGVQVLDALRRAGRELAGRTVVAVCAGLLLCWWTVLSWRQCDAYGDTIRRDQRVVAVFPDSPDAHAELARAYIHEGEPARALAVVGDARRRWPDHVRLVARMGEALLKQREWAAAAEALGRALPGMPQNARLRCLYALALEQTGDRVAAEREYRAALDKNRRFPPALLGLARLCEAGGRPAEARQLYEDALAINPHDRPAALGLAGQRLRAGQPAQALPLLEKLVADDPADMQATLHLGVALAGTGDLAGALDCYARVLTVDPRAVAARLNRAAILRGAGRPDEAAAEYRRILEIEPGQADARAGLEEISRARGGPGSAPAPAG